MKLSLFLALAILGGTFAGCATGSMPSTVAGITFRAVPSASIEIWRPKFRMKDGELALEGYVMRQQKADTTADSHVDIVYLDAAGRELAVDTTNFSPRSLARGTRLPHPHAYFLVRNPHVPPGTVAVEVRGHDGPHSLR